MAQARAKRTNPFLLLWMAAVFACLAGALTGLRPPAAPARRAPPSLERFGQLFAQLTGWTTHVDEAGQTYYCSELTGQCQWEPLQGASAHQRSKIWRLVPTTGVTCEYTVCPGEEQVLGRYDMSYQSLYVSRKQCLVQVAPEGGTATLISLGKPPTLYRAGASAAWQCLWAKQSFGFDEAHALADGDQIGLDIRDPEAVMYTVVCEEERASAGYVDEQYSDDGLWMWNGAEWLPAR